MTREFPPQQIAETFGYHLNFIHTSQIAEDAIRGRKAKVLFLSAYSPGVYADGAR